MADREARLKIGVEGADEAVAAAKKVGDAWSSFGSTATGAVRGLGAAAAEAMSGVVADLSRAALAIGGISFGNAISQARQFGDAVGRMSASTGTSFDKLRSTIQGISKAKLIDPSQVAGLTSSLTRMTYDSKFASDAIGGIADAALATGRTTDELMPMGVMLHNMLGVTGDTSEAFGRLAAQSDAFKPKGGLSGTLDVLQGMQGVLGEISDTAPGAAAKIGALASGFGDKSLSPEKRKGAINSVLGAVEGNKFGWMSTFLGKGMDHYVDSKTGEIKDPVQLLADVQKKFRTTYGKGALQKAQMTFGSIGGSALMNTDFGAVLAGANLTPSTVIGDKAGAYRSSASGKRKASEVNAQLNAINSVSGGVLDAVDKAGDWLSGSPLAAGALSSVGLRLASKGLSGLGGLIRGVGAAVPGGAGAASTTAAAGETGTALSGFTSTGAEVIGGAGAGAAALSLGVLGAGALGTFKTLTEVGQDRGQMGADWRARPEIADVIQKEQEMRARALLARTAPESQATESPEQSVLRKQMEDSGATPELIQQTLAALRDSLDRQATRPIQVTIVNQSASPIQAIDDQKGSTPKQ